MPQRAFITLNLSVDLDQVPGAFNQAEDYVRILEGMLGHSIPHYKPKLEVESISTLSYRWTDDGGWVEPTIESDHQVFPVFVVDSFDGTVSDDQEPVGFANDEKAARSIGALAVTDVARVESRDGVGSWGFGFVVYRNDTAEYWEYCEHKAELEEEPLTIEQWRESNGIVRQHD